MKERILEIMQKATPKMAGYNGENLLDDAGLDSLDIMNVVVELEQAFSIEFDIEDIASENFQTLDTVVDLVQRRMKAE
jgi:acyl carrier protein